MSSRSSSRTSTKSLSSIVLRSRIVSREEIQFGSSTLGSLTPPSSPTPSLGETSTDCALNNGMILNCFYCKDKYYGTIRVLLLSCLLIGFFYYSSEQTYNVFKKELDSLSGHILYLEEFLEKFTCRKEDIEQKIKNLANSLPQLNDITSNLQRDFNKCYGESQENRIRNIVKQELEIYSADKTGRTDYALKSSGGTILTTRETVSLESTNLSLFGYPLCPGNNNPSAMIQPGMLPGECWAFKGSTGTSVIKLIKPIRITGITLEHISKSISPIGHIDTAPNVFSIWGLERVNDKNGFFFGKFRYSLRGDTIQYFPVMHKTTRTFQIIEFKVHSNHGDPHYTCVYRLRVHGNA